MTPKEREEISRLPEKYRPLGAWAYFGYTVLFSIPLVGVICLIIFACDGSQVVRRSFARCYLCVLILVVILVLIAMAAGLGSQVMNALRQ